MPRQNKPSDLTVTLQEALTDARYWRERAERLEHMLGDADEEIARLRVSLARMEAVEAGEPVLAIVKAWRPRKRG